MGYILYAFTFALGVIGWFKRERPSRRTTRIVVILLFLTLVLQSAQSYFTGQEEAELRVEISQIGSKNKRLQDQNDTLLAQNKVLLSKNQELVTRVEGYQGELENQRGSVNRLKEYSHIARLDLTGRRAPGVPSVSFATDIYTYLLPAIRETDSDYYCDCSLETRKVLANAIERYPAFPFSYYLLARCLKQDNDAVWRRYASDAVNILENTTAIPNHLLVHDSVLAELREYMAQDTK